MTISFAALQEEEGTLGTVAVVETQEERAE